MDKRKLEILKNDTAIMLSLAEPGAGGDIIARMDPSTCNAEALREVRRRHDNFQALVEALDMMQEALACYRDGNSILVDHPVHGPITTLEEVKYLVVDPALKAASE